jgi:peptidoglycan/xylan/chitin deacetylase (PgdA/CDA1 family)
LATNRALSGLARGAALCPLLVLVALALPWLSQARAETVVALTFDDGAASQDLARPLLASHAMHGTFYVSSNLIGSNAYFMNWSQVDALHADGNEIGGHTLDNVNLRDVLGDNPAEQRRQICEDAAALRSHGYTVTTFSYPAGAGSTNPNVRSSLLECGFAAGRKHDGLHGSCTTCPYAESLPPPEPYRIRTPDYLARPYTLADLEGWVTQAEDHGGGLVPLIFFDICDGCADSSVSLADFSAFLDWLAPRAASGTVVKTISEIAPPPPTYPRPKGASPVRASLVPAFQECTAPALQHGPPLEHASCSAPAQASGRLTVGAPDANGQPAASLGFVSMTVAPGDPGTPADEADVGLVVSLSDVRSASDLSDYTGELEAVAPLRITDRLNGPPDTNASGTMSDTAFRFTVPCTATEAAAGATCSVSTSADAITPGMAPEGARSVWQLGQIGVTDGGPDDLAATQDNSPFAVQGVFVP